MSLALTLTSIVKSSACANRVRTFKLNKSHCFRFNMPGHETGISLGDAAGVDAGVPVSVNGGVSVWLASYKTLPGLLCAGHGHFGSGVGEKLD